MIAAIRNNGGAGDLCKLINLAISVYWVDKCHVYLVVERVVNMDFSADSAGMQTYV